jgi:hypothetical protein
MGMQPTRIVSDVARRLMLEIRREVRERLGPDATFEQRRDAAAALASDVLWLDADEDLRESITTAEEVVVEERRYRRLDQSSSATYRSRWGSHHIEEPLYREVGVHNGPTIKPIELRVGIIEHMTPDMARIVGELSADKSSRGVERTLRVTGLVPPSRAFLAKHTTEMGIEIADQAAALEQVARTAEIIPAEVAAISTGLDRMSARMSEPADPATAVTPQRTEPYERTPPPPKEHHYRKAWVGSTSVYNAEGNELHTWRYAVEADADPTVLADRVAKDVAWILRAHPGVPVHCVQDAAPELDRLPEALARVLPTNTNVVQLVDLEHLMEYLEDVIDACEPEGDPHDWKGWYRACCCATTTRSTRSGASCATSPSGCRVVAPTHATPSQRHSATSGTASRRCDTPRTTLRTCLSAVARPRARVGRCNNGSSSQANRGTSRACAASSRCALWCSQTAGQSPGCPTQQRIAGTCA